MQSAKHGIFDFRKCGTVLAPFNTPNIELWRDHQPLIPGEVGQVHILIHEARTLYAGEALGVELDSTVYALDATIIDLCMTLFPWAKFKSAQNAVKMHTLLDLRGNIPTFIRITPAKIHDVNFLDDLVPEAGAFYVMDRGYLDFERLYRWTRAGAFFVTRARKNFAFRRLYSHPADKTTGARCDQTIVLESFYPRQGYPAHLRRIAFYDADNDKRLVFLTNNFELNAKTIADLYRSRWQIELFFKWIKQHLRIKAFYGTSENAVRPRHGRAHPDTRAARTPPDRSGNPRMT
jgi:hypothetical protein